MTKISCFSRPMVSTESTSDSYKHYCGGCHFTFYSVSQVIASLVIFYSKLFILKAWLQPPFFPLLNILFLNLLLFWLQAVFTLDPQRLQTTYFACVVAFMKILNSFWYGKMNPFLFKANHCAVEYSNIRENCELFLIVSNWFKN